MGFVRDPKTQEVYDADLNLRLKNIHMEYETGAHYRKLVGDAGEIQFKVSRSFSELPPKKRVKSGRGRLFICEILVTIEYSNFDKFSSKNLEVLITRALDSDVSSSKDYGRILFEYKYNWEEIQR